MKKALLLFVFVLTASLSFGGTLEVKEEILPVPFQCTQTTTTTTLTHANGTVESTTTVAVVCDTPQELATYNKLTKK